MSTEVKPNLPLEIGHVLFIDVVGYSKRLIDDQRELQQQLNEIVRRTGQFCAAEAAGKLVRLPTGDGMALVFFTSPEAPVQCALQISEALQSHPQLQLRMGINTGPVSGVADVNDRSNIAGAGINTAQRVMAVGDPGHILLSKRAAEDLAQYRHWEPHLHDLGECEVKHGVRISIVNLYTGKLGNPQLPQKLKQFSRKRRVKRTLVAALSLLVIMLPVGALMFLQRPPAKLQGSAAPPISNKSIAVLPFENLSEDKQNAYFVAGIQDEILTALAKISDLKVISRNSTAKYNSHPDNIKSVAQDLGVATILEGSVQKAGETVHINVQLINSRNDAHFWAESYDRELKNIFAVEREVAETVAGQLKAKLLPQEATELARVPTTNAQAYDLYLKAKYIHQQYWTAQVDSEKPAIDLYRQAIALDPNFALAYASLSAAEGRMYAGGEDRSPERIADAQINAERSLALQPDLIEGHLALADIYAVEKHGEAKALAEYESLLKRSVNNPKLTLAVAYAKGRAGDWQAQLAGMLRAIELDPRNNQYIRRLGDLFVALRRRQEADQTYARAEFLAPDDWIERANRTLNLISQDKLAEAREAINRWPDTKLKETALSIKYSLLQQIETLSRDYDAALAAASKIPAMGNRIPTPAIPVGDIKKNTDIGFDALYKGDAAGANQAFIAARNDLEPQRASHLDDPDFYNAETLIAAGMNDHDAAIEAARQAVALLPIERDAHAAAIYLLTLAQVYAHFGDASQAIPVIARMFDMPLSGDIISPALLRLDPIWDPIRKDPRFENLVARPETTPNK